MLQFIFGACVLFLMVQVKLIEDWHRMDETTGILIRVVNSKNTPFAVNISADVEVTDTEGTHFKAEAHGFISETEITRSIDIRLPLNPPLPRTWADYKHTLKVTHVDKSAAELAELQNEALEVETMKEEMIGDISAT